MKILMVCTENLPVPPVLGGAIQTYISGSLPYLSKSHDITIMGINDPTLPDEEIIDGVKYIRVPGKVLELYREGVVEYINSNQFDLIHIFNRPRLVLPIRKVAPNAKITLSMHNDMFNLGKIDPEEAKLVIEEVSNIVTVSDYVGNVIRELYPEASNKIRTIYSGVDSDRFLPGNNSKMSEIRDSLRREYGLENKTVILFAGRLSENKGVDRLIRALPQLSKTFKDLALVIVGSNWFSQNNVTDYVAYIRAISKKQEVPVVTTGFVSPFEMQNWFAVADIFVCTSLWQEPLARVHYEAMAAGLPIVTTARGGNPEVIIPGENGLIVENPEDPSEFAAKITEILSNKSLMRSMSNRGRELAISKYTWSRVGNEILEVWNQSQFASAVTSEQLEQYESKLVFKTAAPVQTNKNIPTVSEETQVNENETKEIQIEKELEIVAKQPILEKVIETVGKQPIQERVIETIGKQPIQERVIKTVTMQSFEEKILEALVKQSIRGNMKLGKQTVQIRDVTNVNPITLRKIRSITDRVNANTNAVVEVKDVNTMKETKNELNKPINQQTGLRKISSVTEQYNKKFIS
ncbi:glycosyltransferase family 4 protein [Bacillus sp. JJ664]